MDAVNKAYWVIFSGVGEVSAEDSIFSLPVRLVIGASATEGTRLMHKFTRSNVFKTAFAAENIVDGEITFSCLEIEEPSGAADLVPLPAPPIVLLSELSASVGARSGEGQTELELLLAPRFLTRQSRKSGTNLISITLSSAVMKIGPEGIASIAGGDTLLANKFLSELLRAPRDIGALVILAFLFPKALLVGADTGASN